MSRGSGSGWSGIWILQVKDKRMKTWQQKSGECKTKIRNSNWGKEESDRGETKALFNLLLEHGAQHTPRQYSPYPPVS